MGGKEVINILDVPLDSLSFYTRTERHSKKPSTCVRDKCHQLYSGNSMESFKREKRQEDKRCVFFHIGEGKKPLFFVATNHITHYSMLLLKKVEELCKQYVNGLHILDQIGFLPCVFTVCTMSALCAKYRYAKVASVPRQFHNLKKLQERIIAICIVVPLPSKILDFVT